MSSDLAISVRGVGKQYIIRHEDEQATTLGEWVGRRLRHPFRRMSKERFEALRDISFDVRQGEVVGIIGRNGAGKSTLLKILSRITEPTTGEADLYGRVGTLLEVGTGFHPELTGRENVYLNGSILGMTRREIDARFDQIVDFSGVSQFLDTPVKRYSSGMSVRLAFSVAAHLDTEIMVVDEVLSVGDAAFQEKCLGKIQDVSRSGRSIVFVSHNMSSVLNLCDRVLLLRSGHLVFDGEPDEAVDRYLAQDAASGEFDPTRGIRGGTHLARIEGFGVNPAQPTTGAPVTFMFDLTVDAGAKELSADVAVNFETNRAGKAMQVYSANMGRRFRLTPGSHRVTATLAALPLVPGKYRASLWLGAGDAALDHIKDCFTLQVGSGSYVDGVHVSNRGTPVELPATWELVARDEAPLAGAVR